MEPDSDDELTLAELRDRSRQGWSMNRELALAQQRQAQRRQAQRDFFNSGFVQDYGKTHTFEKRKEPLKGQPILMTPDPRDRANLIHIKHNVIRAAHQARIATMARQREIEAVDAEIAALDAQKRNLKGNYKQKIGQLKAMEPGKDIGMSDDLDVELAREEEAARLADEAAFGKEEE